jgi:DNA-binding FadR family transcriptional regulator
MEPLIRKSLKDVVIDKVKQYIVENDLKAGDRFLNEKEIVDMLKVSRTVVREALKSLETIGILKLKPGDGIYVSTASLQQLMDQFYFRWLGDRKKMRELLETRIILELAAVELAVSKATPQQLQELDEWNDRMEQAIRDKQPIFDTDIGFHRTIFKITGNDTFYELSEVINLFFSEIRSNIAFPSYGHTLEDHRLITESIRAKAVTQAKEAMSMHLNQLKANFEG